MEVQFLRPVVFMWLVWLSATSFSAATGSGSISNCTNNQEAASCGYITVRQGAHMFWWLHRTTHDDGYRQRPWILWIQGGPGLSGSGLGNYLEIGPLDEHLQPRDTTWVQSASVLFVDNPVGVGFSYLDEGAAIARGLEQISQDLVSFLRIFLEDNTEFKEMPLYIFGQSDGGRMTVGLAYHIAMAQKNDSIDIALRGIGIGNGFVSASHFVNSYGPFLYDTSMIDARGLQAVTVAAARFTAAVDQGVTGVRVENLFLDVILEAIGQSGGTLDIYNIMDGRVRRRPGQTLRSMYDINIDRLMNDQVKPALGLIPPSVRWRAFSPKVYSSQYDDAYISVYDKVDFLLEETNVSVAVYQGQMDFICATPGAVAWVEALSWSGMDRYRRANRTALAQPDSRQLEMFVKAHDRLKFYSILGSGHAVPADRPEAALRMFNRILDNADH